MIQLPYDQILTLIEEKSSLSKGEIEQKINTKLDQLSGLISKEGAAHIIANELGVTLGAATGGAGEKLKIKDIAAGVRNVQTVGRVVQKYELREFNSNGREGKVGNFLLGDETGVMRVVMWNAVADNLQKLKEGDTVKITSAYSRMNNSRIELHLNDNSTLEINPSGEEVPQVAQQRSEFERKKIAELSEADSEAEILGTIVQVFDPRFFEVDPQTGRRIRPREDNIFYNESGQPINPDYSYVFNLFVDDGTDNLRIVCFRNQMQRVLDKSHEEILEFRTNPQGFEAAKHDLLGKMVKVQGRVVRNDMFDRLEMVSSRIFIDVNPQEELERLGGSSEKTTVQPAQTAPQQTQEPSSQTSSPSPERRQSESSPGPVAAVGAAVAGAAVSLDDLGDADEASSDDESYTPDVSEVPKDQLDFKSGSEVSSSSTDAENTADATDDSLDDDLETPKKQSTSADEDADDLGDLDDLEELDSFDDDM